MADDRKILEIKASGNDDPGTSLVPYTGSPEAPGEEIGRALQTQANSLEHSLETLTGDLVNQQETAYARFMGAFLDEFIRFFSPGGEGDQWDTHEGEYTTNGGDGGPPPPPFGPPPIPPDDDLTGGPVPDDDEINRLNKALGATGEDADATGTALEVLEDDALTLGMALGLTTAAFGALLGSAYLFNEAVNGMVEAVGAFSAEVVQASTESRIREIEDRMRLADEAGGQIAELEKVRNEIASTLRGLFRDGIENLGPALADIGRFILAGLKLLQPILSVLEQIFAWCENVLAATTNFVVNVLSWLPLVGPAIKRWHDDLMKSDKHESPDLSRRFDALFGVADIPFDIADIKRNVANGGSSSPDSPPSNDTQDITPPGGYIRRF